MSDEHNKYWESTKQKPEESARTLALWRNEPLLNVTIQGMSTLINTRLSNKALEMCLELLEAGVNGRVLAHVVLQVIENKKALEKDTEEPVKGKLATNTNNRP